jgi:hypothetical protein
MVRADSWRGSTRTRCWSRQDAPARARVDRAIVLPRADHADRVTTLGFIDGERPVSVDGTGRIIVWRGDGTIDSTRDLGLFDAKNVDALAPDGHRLYVGRPSDDERSGHHSVIDVLTGEVVRKAKDEPAYAATWAGRDTVLVDLYAMKLWTADGRFGEPDETLRDSRLAYAASDDGGVIVVRDSTYGYGEPSEFMRLLRCDAHARCRARLRPCGVRARVASDSLIAVSGDGSRYAVQCNDGYVAVSPFAAQKEERPRSAWARAARRSRGRGRLAVRRTPPGYGTWPPARTARARHGSTRRLAVVFDRTGAASCHRRRRAPAALDVAKDVTRTFALRSLTLRGSSRPRNPALDAGARRSRDLHRLVVDAGGCGRGAGDGAGGRGRASGSAPRIRGEERPPPDRGARVRRALLIAATAAPRARPASWHTAADARRARGGQRGSRRVTRSRRRATLTSAGLATIGALAR